MEKSKYIGRKVIIRGVESGVYFGTIGSIEGRTVELLNCRNIWMWSGAATLFQLATDGIKNLEDSKISVVVKKALFTDICEIIPCEEKAVRCLEGAKAWSV